MALGVNELNLKSSDLIEYNISPFSVNLRSLFGTVIVWM